MLPVATGKVPSTQDVGWPVVFCIADPDICMDAGVTFNHKYLHAKHVEDAKKRATLSLTSHPCYLHDLRLEKAILKSPFSCRCSFMPR